MILSLNQREITDDLPVAKRLKQFKLILLLNTQTHIVNNRDSSNFAITGINYYVKMWTS